MGKSMIAAFAEALEVLSKSDAKVVKADRMDDAVSLAEKGYVPFFSSPALFGEEDVFVKMHNCCYHNTNVKLSINLADDIWKEDSGITFGTEDIALMRGFPNLTILVPCDAFEAEKAAAAAVKIAGPVYIRMALKDCETITSVNTPFKPGKANILKEGIDVCIITAGVMVSVALKAASILESEEISTAVVNMHTIKPIDEDMVLQMNDNCDVIVTLEEHSVSGGLGTAVAEILAGHDGAGFARVGIQSGIKGLAEAKASDQTDCLTPEAVIRAAKSLL